MPDILLHKSIRKGFNRLLLVSFKEREVIQWFKTKIRLFLKGTVSINFYMDIILLI